MSYTAISIISRISAIAACADSSSKILRIGWPAACNWRMLPFVDASSTTLRCSMDGDNAMLCSLGHSIPLCTLFSGVSSSLIPRMMIPKVWFRLCIERGPLSDAKAHLIVGKLRVIAESSAALYAALTRTNCCNDGKWDSNACASSVSGLS